MPLVQSRLSQNMQFTWDTHLFLKLALDVDIVVLPKWTNSRSFCPPESKCSRKNKNRGVLLLTIRRDINTQFDVNFAGFNLALTSLCKR